MVSIRVERLDHLGVIAAVIKDVGLIPMINARLVPDAQETITPGEAIAAMMLNGLGFANRPLSLTPQFFASKPLDWLFRAGMSTEMFNRFTLGRTLDEVYTYGCDLLFQELALAVCAQAGIALRCLRRTTGELGDKSRVKRVRRKPRFIQGFFRFGMQDFRSLCTDQ